MAFYLMITAAVTVVGVILRCAVPNKKLASGIFCILSFLVLGSLSAFRYNVGYDYSYIYAPLYEPVLADPFISSAELVHEPGFVLLERLISLCSRNYQMLFIVTSYLIVGLFMLYYYLYSPNPVISVFLFLSLSHFYGSMNFIRQTLAAVICLYAMPFLQKKKFWRYCLLVLIASAFHTSALIMLVFYFVNLLPVNGKTLAIYAPVAVIFYLSSTGIIGLVTSYVYEHYSVEDPMVATGFPLDFVLTILLVFLAMFFGRKLLTLRNKSNYVYVNYAFFALLFLFLGTKHSILDRFSLFFGLASPVGFAILFTELREKFPRFRELLALRKEKGLDTGIKRAILTYGACLIVLAGGATGAHIHDLMFDGHGVIPYQFIYDQSFYADYLAGLKPR